MGFLEKLRGLFARRYVSSVIVTVGDNGGRPDDEMYEQTKYEVLEGRVLRKRLWKRGTAQRLLLKPITPQALVEVYTYSDIGGYCTEAKHYLKRQGRKK